MRYESFKHKRLGRKGRGGRAQDAPALVLLSFSLFFYRPLPPPVTETYHRISACASSIFSNHCVPTAPSPPRPTTFSFSLVSLSLLPYLAIYPNFPHTLYSFSHKKIPASYTLISVSLYLSFLFLPHSPTQRLLSSLQVNHRTQQQSS